MILKSILVSSLEKVFPDEEPRAFDGRVEGFKNEIAYDYIKQLFNMSRLNEKELGSKFI